MTDERDDIRQEVLPFPAMAGAHRVLVRQEWPTISAQLAAGWTLKMALVDLERRFGPEAAPSYRHFHRLVRRLTPKPVQQEVYSDSQQPHQNVIPSASEPIEPEPASRYPGTGGTFRHKKRPDRDSLY